MGGAHHPVLGFLGVMSAKNTAVNVLILTTYVSFLFYRRTGKRPTVSWARIGNLAQFAIFAAATGIVIFYGIYGYFVEAAVRIGFSVPQVGSVLVAMVAMTAIDIPLMRGAAAAGETLGAGAQQLAVLSDLHRRDLHLADGPDGLCTFGAAVHWRIYGVLADTSVDAFTPPRYATRSSPCACCCTSRWSPSSLARQPARQTDWGTEPSSGATHTHDNAVFHEGAVGQRGGGGVGATLFYTTSGQLSRRRRSSRRGDRDQQRDDPAELAKIGDKLAHDKGCADLPHHRLARRRAASLPDLAGWQSVRRRTFPG